MFHQTSYEYDEWEEAESPKDRHERHYEPVYKADKENFPNKWFPAIHMPRAFSRIYLEITNIRVQRLQDIRSKDAECEGVEKLGQCLWRDYLGTEPDNYINPVASFASLWVSINGEQSWNDNPFVWVVEFKRLAP